MSQFSTFFLDSASPLKTFSLQQPSDHIIIHEIELPMLENFSIQTWPDHVNGIFITILARDNQGGTNSSTIKLTVDPNQTKPVFTFNKVAPYQHTNGQSNSNFYYNTIEIVLTAPYKHSAYRFEVRFEKTAGVVG